MSDCFLWDNKCGVSGVLRCLKTVRLPTKATLNTFCAVTAALVVMSLASSAMSANSVNVAPMNTARFHHTATLLTNGKVLVAGGFNTSSAELYDFATGTWSATGAMSTIRLNHAAILLLNGKVLVAGGTTGSGTLSSAELYDPATGTWTVTGSMTTVRYGP